MPPVNQLTTPPVFGTVFANSISALPAVVEFITASALIPVTAREYSFIASPKGVIPSAKAARSFSPVNQPTIPPVVGSVFASSMSANPAVVELTTASALIPVTAREYDFIASPKGVIPLANDSKSLSPANQLTTPPVFGRFASRAAKACAAVAEAVTASGLIPLIALL